MIVWTENSFGGKRKLTENIVETALAIMGSEAYCVDLKKKGGWECEWGGYVRSRIRLLIDS